MSKNATIRLNDETHEFLKTNFEGIQAAISLIVEPFDKLRQVTMNELKGYFSKEELVSLIDSQNGTMLTPDFIYNKSFWVFQLQDFEQLENGISRHGADSEVLMDKLNKLSQSQVYIFLMDIHIFWNTNGDLNKYIERMV